MEITKIYPLDAIYDKLEDVPEDVMKYVVSNVYVKVGDCFCNNNFFLSFSAGKIKQALFRVL